MKKMGKDLSKNQSVSEPDEFGKRLSDLSSSDFDGHTEFKNMSYTERLKWLSQAVLFSVKYSKTKKTQ